MPEPVTSGARAATVRPGNIGFHGKIPARGDFVRFGLPRGFVEPWDAWLQRMLAASRTELGDAWLPAWLEAPIWRFALPPGLCGPDAVLGLWLPSVDRVGRYFPLTLAAVAAEADAGGLICRGGGFLAAGEQAGCDAVTQELSPDELNARLVAAAAALPADPGVDPGLCKPFGSLWWTAGAPRVQAAAFSTDGLPDSATFTRMLDDRVCAAIVARCEADP